MSRKKNNMKEMVWVTTIIALFLFAYTEIAYAQPKISAELRATPETYSGPCLTTIKFQGKITVTNIGKPPLKV